MKADDVSSAGLLLVRCDGAGIPFSPEGIRGSGVAVTLHMQGIDHELG